MYLLLQSSSESWIPLSKTLNQTRITINLKDFMVSLLRASSHLLLPPETAWNKVSLVSGINPIVGGWLLHFTMCHCVPHHLFNLWFFFYVQERLDCWTSFSDSEVSKLNYWVELFRHHLYHIFHTDSLNSSKQKRSGARKVPREKCEINKLFRNTQADVSFSECVCMYCVGILSLEVPREQK